MYNFANICTILLIHVSTAELLQLYILALYQVSILHKSIAGRYRHVRVADGLITVRYRFMWNTSWGISHIQLFVDGTGSLSMKLGGTEISSFIRIRLFSFNANIFRLI